MSKKQAGIIVSVLGLLSLVLVGYEVEAQTVGTAPATPGVRPAGAQSPILNATSSDVAQRAIALTNARFRRVTGPVTVALSRRVLPSELPRLGFQNLGLRDSDTQLQLVVLQGDFDAQGAFPGWSNKNNAPMAARYVTYVYDLRAGAPLLIQTSRAGEGLRQVLNNPALPDRPAASHVALPAQHARFASAPVGDVPYGTVAQGQSKDAPPPRPVPTMVGR